jgi:hypothetical protein
VSRVAQPDYPKLEDVERGITQRGADRGTGDHVAQKVPRMMREAATHSAMNSSAPCNCG